MDEVYIGVRVVVPLLFETSCVLLELSIDQIIIYLSIVPESKDLELLMFYKVDDVLIGVVPLVLVFGV